MDKVIAYYSRRQIDLTHPISGILHWNLPMDSSSFRIYKGTKNAIEVMVRNNDRKSINLTVFMLIMTIANPENNQVILQKPLVIHDPLQGSAVLVLNQFDTADWLFGFYRWNIVLQRSDSTQSVLYVDQNQGGYGYFELIEGPVIGPNDSLVCNNFLAGEFTLFNTLFYYSDVFPGNAQTNQHDFGAITVANYVTNWTGSIYIEGSVEDSMPLNDVAWFPITINDQPYSSVTNFTGIVPITFEASLAWVRVKYLSDVFNQGTFDKVLFRT